MGTLMVALRAIAKAILRPENVRQFQGVSSRHSSKHLLSGRFNDIYEQFWSLDPFNKPTGGDRMRMRIYNLCSLSDAVTSVRGEVLMIGVAWGVAQRVLYEYAGREMVLVDPFLGVNNSQGDIAAGRYNADINYVKRQYPDGAKLRFVERFIPDALDEVSGPIAMAHMDSGDYESEAKSLPYIYSILSPGGVVIIDNYAIDHGHEDVYAAALACIKAIPFVLPTGQAVIFKSH